jgi:transcriptional regulator with XRE-family HTH domain
VQVSGGSVAWRTGVHHDNLAECPRQDECRGESGGASADNCYVVLNHAHQVGAAWVARQRMLLFLGKPTGMNIMDDPSSAIEDPLDQVGARLKRIRLRRRITLTGLANTTGLSKSTLSRLETGQRRPTLELLLALSKAYRVPLDDLVGAPEVGDPRIHLKPGQVKGMTVIPLTRQPDGMQAWKIVIPTSKVKPEPRAHDGYEWIYVLSGHLRLILGDQDWILGPGEVAEFDTGVPHWFGSTGHDPAEVLSIFTRPGERMSVRTTQPQA